MQCFFFKVLESKEESPRKIQHPPKKTNSQLPSEKDRFVEVSIDGTAEAKSDSDDEPIFDRVRYVLNCYFFPAY